MRMSPRGPFLHGIHNGGRPRGQRPSAHRCGGGQRGFASPGEPDRWIGKVLNALCHIYIYIYIWEVAKLTRAGFFTLWHSRPVVRFFRLWQGCGQPWPAHPPARPSQMGSFLAWGSIWTSRHSKKNV